MRNLLMCLAAICLTTGCVGLIKQPPAIPSEYTLRCEVPGSLFAGDHVSVEIWAIRTATDARVCAERHGKLVEAIKRRDALYK